MPSEAFVQACGVVGSEFLFAPRSLQDVALLGCWRLALLPLPALFPSGPLRVAATEPMHDCPMTKHARPLAAQCSRAAGGDAAAAGVAAVAHQKRRRPLAPLPWLVQLW